MDDESPTKRDTAHSTPSTPAADDTIRVDDRHANGDKKIKKEGGRGGEDEADAAADTRPKYRSWKKKWRKLRVTFDHKMREAEVLWLSEQRAKATIKRIAIENEFVLASPFPFSMSRKKHIELTLLTQSSPRPSHRH